MEDSDLYLELQIEMHRLFKFLKTLYLFEMWDGREIFWL